MRRHRRSLLTAFAAAALAVAPATAQTGGLAGLLKGGGLPDIGSTGTGNAAGLLSYCLKNQLLGGAAGGGVGSLLGTATGGGGPASDGAATSGGAASVLGALTGRRGVTGTPGFNAGQNGTIVTGQGQRLPIGGLGDTVKGKLCAMVLQHARSLL